MENKIKEKILNLRFLKNLKNTFKENFKRIGAFVLAFLLSFIAIAPGIKAESGSSSWIPGFYYKASGGTYGQMTRLYIDGEDVFCLEPGKIFIDGEYSQGNVSSVLSDEQKDMIELIHHFGYVLNGKGDRNRAFTQVAIWEIVGGYVRIGTSNGSNDRRGDYESWLRDTNNKINAWLNVPSWNKTTVKGKIGDTITLDGEGKIDGSYVTEDGGSSVWVENGKIKIKVTNSSQSGYVRLRKKPAGYDDAKGVTIVYQKSGSQKVGRINLGLDPTPYSVNLEVEKKPTTAKVHKVGEDGEPVAGAVFEMCYSKDFKSAYVYTFTTNKNGYTDFDTWNYHGQTVYVREKSVPYPYIKSNEVKSFTVAPGKNVVIKFINKKQGMKLDILKVGDDGKVIPGTVFLISYTRDFKPKETFEFKTGQNGHTNFGTFAKFGKTLYVKEKSVPAPYIKSDEVQTTTVEAGKTKTLKFTNKKAKGEIILKKIDEESKTALNNIEFKLYKNSVSNNNFIKTYYTGKNGELKISNLELGKYILRETKTANGYFLDNSKRDIVVNLNFNGAVKVVKEVKVTNKKVKGEIKVKKLDKENNKPLANVIFKLYKNSVSDSNFISEHKTNSKGEIVISNLELGKYILREVKTADGYFLDEKSRDTEFTLSYKNQSVEKVISDKKITNTRQKASLVLSKEADLFKGYADKQVSLMGKTYTVKVPTFEKGYLSKVKFNLMQNGKVVRTFTTGNEPYKINDLELGSYILKEVATSNGYVLDTTEYPIKFEYKGQNVAINLQSKNIFNKRQRATFEFTKEFEKEKYFENEKEAVIGLFTAKDQNGLKANTLVNVAHITKDNLKGSFENIIAGEYYLKELDTTKAFKLNQKQYKLNFAYTDKGKEHTTIKLSETFINELVRGNVEILKLDAKTKKPLPGAKFGLYTENNTKVGTYTTNNEGKIVVKDLEIGTYYFKEEYAPEGFKINKEPLGFKVETNGKTHYTTVENERIPYDVELTKTDLTTGKPVEGATLEVYEKETDLKVYEAVTDKDGKLPDLKLPFGEYYFLETKAPEGYLLNLAKQYFTVHKDGKVKGHTNIEDERKLYDVELTKTELTTGKAVPGATLEVYEKETGKKVYEAVTDKDGKLPGLKLPFGEYYFLETKAPKGYLLNDKKQYFTVERSGKVVGHTNIENEKIKREVEFTKKDTMNLKAVEGATLEVQDAKTKKVVWTGTTGKDGKVKLVLEYGEYIYHEIVAPKGYVKADKYGKIIVTEKGATIQEVVWNEPITSDYELTKKDTISLKALSGCEVEIKNAETGEVVFKGVTDENGKIKVKLRFGKYHLTEIIAPKGYVKATKVLEINVTENGAKIEQTLYNDKIQTIPKTNLASNFVMFIIATIGSLGFGLYCLKKKAEEEN